MTTTPDVLPQLNAALDGLSLALQSGDPDAVLAAELPLAAAVHALAQLDRSSIVPSPALAVTLLETRRAVERCVRLGQTSADLLSILTNQVTYGPEGRRSGSASFGRGRVGPRPELACQA